MNTPPLEELLIMSRGDSTRATTDEFDKLRELLDELEAYTRSEADGIDASHLRWYDGVTFAINHIRYHLDTSTKND